jgi:predicted O-linked N-acetylglucosamine transferase (SPINDLY family)
MDNSGRFGAKPLDLTQMIAEAVRLHRTGALTQAERVYRRILNTRSDHFEARHLLGVLRLHQGRVSEAFELVAAALAARPDYVPALSTQALLLVQSGRLEEALAIYERALLIEPDSAELLNDRGNTLNGLGRREQALASYERALAARPDYPKALNNRGLVLSMLGRYEEALASYRTALAIRPNDADLHNNRGIALSALKRNQEALASFDKALTLAPDNAAVLSSRGLVLSKLGRHTDALASYDRALAITPDDTDIHSGRVFVLDLIPGLGFAEHYAARQAWYGALANSRPVQARPHQNSPDPSHRLRLGYVSGDFCEHSAAATFGAVLRRHDRGSFQVVCYSGVIAEDELTREFRQSADIWRPMQDLSDDALAEQIRADGIDILIDLSGHSAGSRLTMFAHKPAPVQVTAWGHATGTGLPTIDYLFSDPVAVPQTMRPLFAEAIYDLPCLITFEAPSNAPPVSKLPAQSCGNLTFGCLNRFAKVSPALLEQWARVLQAVPGSRLLLKDSALDEPALQTLARDRLSRCGIAADRIILRGRTPRPEHLATFSEIDIALDPFPQNGGVSTWEALWQGVPVVTVLGNSLPGRLSGAILSAVGLNEWVAKTEDDYVALAINKASDIAALARLRQELRSAVAASAAGNPLHYTRAVEQGYRWMWRRWCASHMKNPGENARRGVEI